MPMKKYLLLLFTVCYSAFLMAYQLRGTVKDANNQPIPYATVSIKNTTYAVSANLNGEYFMELSEGNYTILYSFTGHLPVERQINVETKNVILNIVLLEDNELEEIEVKISKRDYAFELISNAIKSRDSIRNQYSQYYCNAYIKASIEKEPIKQEDTLNEKSKMEFVESYSEYSFSKPNKKKEKKVAYRDLSQKYNSSINVSFNMEEDHYYSQSSMINPNLFKLNLDQAEFNFYDNLLNIPSLGEVPFTSPIASTAFLSYKYKYIEGFEEDGKLINKIKVIPRVKNGALFSGYIYIVEDSWNIKAVEFELPAAMLIHYNYFKLFQEYEEVDEKWVVTREEFYYNTKFEGNNLLGNTLIKYQNYTFDLNFDKKYFSNELRIISDEALERDSLYWENVRPITLKDEEIEYVNTQDSIIQYHKSKEYLKQQDSIHNHINIWSILLNGVYHRNSFTKTEYHFGSILESMDPFGVGGYRHSLLGDASQELNKGKKVDVSYNLNYGFNNKDIKGSVGFGYMYDAKKLARVHGG